MSQSLDQQKELYDTLKKSDELDALLHGRLDRKMVSSSYTEALLQLLVWPSNSQLQTKRPQQPKDSLLPSYTFIGISHDRFDQEIALIIRHESSSKSN